MFEGLIKALVKIGEPAVEPLIQALGYKERLVAVGASWVLREIGESAVEPLIQALRKDERWEVRGLAAETLGEIGDARAVEPLTQALKKDEWIREAAKRALKKLKAKKS